MYMMACGSRQGSEIVMRGCGAQDERIRRVIAEIRAIYDNVRELIEYVGGGGGPGPLCSRT